MCPDILGRSTCLGLLGICVVIEIIHPGVNFFIAPRRCILTLCLGVMRAYFVLVDGSAFRLHLSVFDPFLKFFFLADDVLAKIVVEVSDVDICFFEDLLNLTVIGFIEIHLCLVLVLPLLQLGSLALLDALLVHRRPFCEVHLLDDVFLEHEGVDLALEVIVAAVGSTLQDFDGELFMICFTI